MTVNSFRSFFFISILFFFSGNLTAGDTTTTGKKLYGFCGTNAYPSSKGTYYFCWGYNTEWYTKTNLHFFDESGDYDFTLHAMKAQDRPQLRDVFKVALTIPQYGYRMGYYFPGSKFGLELNFDHAKYIVTDSQTVRLTGRINDHFYDLDTMVTTDDFMHLEHTDGANFLMLNGLWRKKIFMGEKRNFVLNGILKAGIGIVVPRSDVTLWGERNNHCFHVAGQIIGVETGLRAEFFRYVFIEGTFKASYANFNKVLGVGDGLISHRFGTAALLMHGGFQFPLGK